jgi:hypothetical protein
MRLQSAKSYNLPARSSSAIAAGIVPPAAITAATGWLRPCFVYVQRSAVKFGAIELRDGGLGGLGFGHFDKCEAASLPCVTIRNDIHALHASVGGECGLKVVLSSLITEIPDKNVGHSVNPLVVCELSLSDCSETNL